MTDAPQIGSVSPEHRAEVLALVFGDLLPEDRQRRAQALRVEPLSNETSMDGLVAARRGGGLVGGVFAEPQAGRAALVWPARLVPGEPASTARQLMAAASDALAGGQIRIAYALLQAGRDDDGELLRTAGFEPLAELVYLVCSEEHFPDACPPSPVEFEPYRLANHDRLARVVEATYEGTLDCPRLNGIRQIDDVLAGYRATGVFSAERWLLVRHQGEDVGCLILADHPEQENRELVYMGLAPLARGKGWGRHITRHAQWLTRRAGRARLVLAVDAANRPAMRMYRALGFHPWERRTVYLKVVEPSR
jgi:ribosomal protein S18 acetylase RimI-like enzyme